MYIKCYLLQKIRLQRNSALQKEQTHQKRIELQALQLCCDGPAPLFQEELDLEETPLQMYSPVRPE